MNCSFCKIEFLIEHAQYCHACGTENTKFISGPEVLQDGLVLQAGEKDQKYKIEKCLSVVEGLRLYSARSLSDQSQVRIFQFLPKVDLIANFNARVELEETKLFPKVHAYYFENGTHFFIEESISWDKFYFADLKNVVDLAQKMRQFLAALEKVHKLNWSVADLISNGIYSRQDGTPVIGFDGLITHYAYPVAEIEDYYNSALFPGLSAAYLDLLKLLESIWKFLNTDDPWKELWLSVIKESHKKRRRDVFYKALCFSTLIIEWPPFGEVISDFLSDPAIWTAQDLRDRLTSNPPSLPHQVEVLSHRGLKRGNNEDALLANQYQVWLEGIPTKAFLFVVCDGMGGAGGGEVAARIALSSIDKVVHDFISSGGLVLSSMQLKNAVEIANLEVFEARKKPGAALNMGTTVVACLLVGSRYTIAWVGDSRAYKLKKDGSLERLTQDHSMAAELVKNGVISADAAENHPLASKLTKAIGYKETVEADIVNGELEYGQGIMLASDGFFPALKDFSFPTKNSLKEGLDALTVRMLKRGGDDNASLVVVKLV